MAEVQLLEGEYAHYVLPTHEGLLEQCTEAIKETEWSSVSVDQRKGEITILCTPPLVDLLSGGNSEIAKVEDTGLVGFSVANYDDMSKIITLLGKNRIVLSAQFILNNHTFYGWVVQFHQPGLIQLLTEAGYSVSQPQAGTVEETVEATKELSKKELKRRQKEAEKQKKLKARLKQEEEERKAKLQKFLGPTNLTLQNFETSNFGVLAIDSSVRTSRIFSNLQQLEAMVKEHAWIRASVHKIRKQGKNCTFLELRQGDQTIQCVVSGLELAGFASVLTLESIIDLYGQVNEPPDGEIQSCTLKRVELTAVRMYCISLADPLPVQLKDLARPDSEYEEEEKNDKPTNNKLVRVNLETRLDNRILDLRTPANQAILRLSSKTCQFFRDHLVKNGFTEIHTPKLLAAGSEGGAEVFTVDYSFSKDNQRKAYLAQSPQLYKQMALMSGLDKVFEVAPVFRAEESCTYRHATEFIGLDLEMKFKEHYHEVLDVIDGLFHSIFSRLSEECHPELEAVRQQHPFENLKWVYPSPRYSFKEAIGFLKEGGPPILEQKIAILDAEINQLEGIPPGTRSVALETKLKTKKEDASRYKDHLGTIQSHQEDEDISTEDEKLIGEVIKSKFDIDFYFLDKFPAAIRPFYSMPSPENSKWANSYDLFMRGEEIMSGAQRIHDPKLLLERAKVCCVDLGPVQAYVDSLRYGAEPHAGGGVGMERVVMLFLSLPNIRKVAMFPRDPKRLTP